MTFFEGPLQESFKILLLLSGVPLVLIALAGLFVGVLQAATQIQEQAISYMVRFGVLAILCIFFHEWFFSLLLELMDQMLRGITTLGGLS